MDDLMAYLSKRMQNFQKYESVMPEDESIFLDSLINIFENRIFCQFKSNFLQYIPLFIIAHSDKNLEYSSLKLSKQAIAGCKKFSEKIMSFLILKAFETKRGSLDNSSGSSDSEEGP